MKDLVEEVTATPEGRRAFEEEVLIGEVTDTIAGLLESSSVSQRELARRLGVTEGRVSQILSGTGNLRLRSVAAVAWALGVRFSMRARPLAERAGTPAAEDPPLPEWIHGPAGPAQIVAGWDPDAKRRFLQDGGRWLSKSRPMVVVHSNGEREVRAAV